MFQSYQLITGAPLTNDDSPNTTPPSAERIFVPSKGTASILVQLLDGTSATATVWSKAAGAATWTVGASGSVVTDVPVKIAVTVGVSIFVQLTSIVGSPTACVVLDAVAAPSLLTQLASGKVSSVLKAAVDATTTAVGTLLAALEPYDAALAIVAGTPFAASRAVIVTGAGSLVCRFAADGADITIPTILPGLYRFELTNVVVAGTTATVAVALY